MEQTKLFEIDDSSPDEERNRIDCIRLVNVKTNNVISAKEVSQLFDGLNRIHQLEDLENLYASRDFEQVRVGSFIS